MTDTMILGKTLSAWKQEFPIIEDICALHETCWRNPQKEDYLKGIAQCPLSQAGVEDASRRKE